MKPAIPFTDNPEHVANLSSVALLEAQGFEGGDASLEISLADYGLVWRQLPNREWLFVYRHPSIPGAFDRAPVRERDPRKEWDWVDWDSFLDHNGVEMADWIESTFPRQVADLVAYYGTENVFGTSYWEGFRIEGI